MLGQVESVKAVSDLYAPVTLEITEVNSGLPDDLDKLSNDAFGAGWIVKGVILDESQLSKLLDHTAYQAQCAEEGS